MNTRILKGIGLPTIAVILFLIAGCTVGSKLRTEVESVELGGASFVRVEIEMGTGKLKIAGGADELMKGNFTYRIASWKPRIDYSISGDEGKLVIQQPETRHVKVGKIRYEWDLHFNNDVPMDLSVELGAGYNQLNLGNLSLTRLDLSTGVGEVEVDLTGNRESDLDVNIEAGIGRTTLLLPKNVGVRVKVERGIGVVNASGLKKEGDIYENEAYGESEVTLHIDIEAGIGEINLELGE